MVSGFVGRRSLGDMLSLLIPIAVAAVVVVGTAEARPHAECGDCHVRGITGAVADNRAALVARCESCHADHAVAVDSRGTVIGAGHVLPGHRTRLGAAPGGGPGFDTLDCLDCHDPHPNGRSRQLKALARSFATDTGGQLDPISAFCAACHPSMVDVGSAGHYRRHPVGVRVASGSRTELPLLDVAGTPSPADDVIGCTTCHAVHAGPEPYLLRWSADEQGATCLGCHASIRRDATLWARDSRR